ncbi:class I SAM-dependent methyltransferase [uncultured Tateyamaria sp.]|uniref:class I SAM-dependent methyltransferase n=1 Tax=uncultured Tateyamaria sp. TaxID=455651 RepID=UPI002635B246|nr:class I SAM-dependent methyltransferase [uncultured Tateyamaria sp.]
MLNRLTRFDTPRPARGGGTLARIYDAAETGWQDGISKLGFLDAYTDLMAHSPAPEPAHPKLMDVGTGTGAFAQAWINAHGHPRALTLTDISPAMLKAAKSRMPEARTINAPLGATLPDVPAQDVVLCAHVIEHLSDPRAALRWLHDQLAPGGLLIMAISKPHWCTALVRWRWGNAAFAPSQTRTMLEQAGFTDITTHPFRAGPPSRVSCGYIARRP